MFEILCKVCRIDSVYRGEKKDYIVIALPGGNKLKFSTEKNIIKYDQEADFNKTLSLKAKSESRLFKAGNSEFTSLHFVEIDVKEIQ